MKQNSLRLIFPCALLIALSACARDSSPTNAPAANSPNAVAPANANTVVAKPSPKSPLEGIVSASIERVEMKAGETVETSVRLNITSGYHVNANQVSEKFLIPTTLTIKPEAGITAEKFVYPKPLRKKFSFNEAPLDVYEGDAVIKLTLRAPRDAAPGQHTMRADIRVQPCDDEKCYPPSTLTTNFEVAIR
jgi:DsbC/DsbD-like thiol-disulfide interchange protein